MRIAKFIDDLDVYELQCNELQYWGDIEEISKYVSRVHRLDEKYGNFPQKWFSVGNIIKYLFYLLNFMYRLSQALQRIDQFNEEETSFGYEVSQYPKRKMVYDKMVPFKKLFDAAYDYLEKNRLWMTSKVRFYSLDLYVRLMCARIIMRLFWQVGSFDPEEIEGDVAYYYKIVYKLEKSFADVPETHRLAEDVRYMV